MRFVVSDDPALDASALIVRRLRASVRDRGHATLALSGGSTAPPMIDAIAAALSTQPTLAAAVTVWQVDERIAPDGDVNRNASQLAVLPCAVRLMPVTSVDLRAAARRYARTLPERFDIVHLGLGDDGHIASWPPAEPTVASSPRLVELTGVFNGMRRMTLTQLVVNGARSRVVLARGASKRPVVGSWIEGDSTLPISLVRATNTAVFLDDAASLDA